MRVTMIFDDWRKSGVSVYQTPEGLELSKGDLHSGTCWDCDVILPLDIEEELQEAIDAGYQPVFWMSSSHKV